MSALVECPVVDLRADHVSAMDGLHCTLIGLQHHRIVGDAEQSAVDHAPIQLQPNHLADRLGKESRQRVGAILEPASNGSLSRQRGRARRGRAERTCARRWTRPGRCARRS